VEGKAEGIGMNMKDEEIDFNSLAYGLKRLHESVTNDHYETVFGVVELLRRTPLPPGYVTSIQSEMYMLLSHGHKKTKGSNVYLAFYGHDDRATHMKIGVANDIKKRMDTFKTGNPFPNMFTYGAHFHERKEAFTVETALLKHLSASAVHGEWVSVGAISAEAAKKITESLAEVAGYAINSLVEFRLCEV
jgi:hypothetical protein